MVLDLKQGTFHLLEQFCLWGIIISLPIMFMPKRYNIFGLGGNLPSYFLVICIILMAAEFLLCHKFNSICNSQTKKFICTFVIWQICCVIIGAFCFPFYTDVHLYQIEKLEKILFSLNMTNQQGFFTPLWMFAVAIKNLVREYFLPLIGIFILITHLYQSNFAKGIKTVTYAVIILTCVLGLYSIPELVWLKTNNNICAKILQTINVYLFTPASSNGWWPPLLLNNQLRSMFAEPSFFGIAAAFMVPFLCDIIYKTKNNIYYILFFYFSFMIFATNSRTAIIIFIMEIVLVGLFLFIRKGKEEYIFVTTVFFLALMGFMLHMMIVNSSTKEYVESNVASIATVNERSNTARYGNTIATLRVGIEHPIFGVGYGYKDMYMIDQFPSFSKDSQEVGEWTGDLIRFGMFKSGYPTLNQYARIFAESGFVGLLLFLYPIIYIFFTLYKKKYLLKNFSIFCLSIACLGQCVAMLSNGFFYSYPVALSLLFCGIKYYNKKDDKLSG